MVNQQQMTEFLTGFDGVEVDDKFAPGVVAFKAIQPDDEAKLFALINDGSQPLKISLRCDPQLAKTLRLRYETVLPGENLSRRDWNTIICSGQLTEAEVVDLARHSYLLVTNQAD